jgi:hypothetical protein
VVWNRIGERYRTRYINRVLEVIYRRQESTTDPGKRSPDPGAFPHSLRFWASSALENDLSWFPYAPLEFLRYASLYARFSFHSKVSLFRQGLELTNTGARLLWLAAWPVGLIYYRRDRWRSQ